MFNFCMKTLYIVQHLSKMYESVVCLATYNEVKIVKSSFLTWKLCRVQQASE